MDLKHVSSLYEKERWTKKALQLLANGIPEQVREQATYRFEELVKSCHFNGIPCNRLLNCRLNILLNCPLYTFKTESIF